MQTILNFIRKRIKVILLLAVLAVIGFNYYQDSQESQKKKTVKTYSLRKGDLEEKLILSGEIDAEEKATLRFQTSGRLAWVGVKEGDYVKKYQAIASLDQREVKKNLEKELRDYLTERWDFEQKRDDYNVKTQSPNDAGHLTVAQRRIMEKAQFSLDITVFDVEIQNLTKEFANLWTPITGIVTKVGTPFAGVNITPTNSEFEIINPDTVFFRASADQTEVIKLKEGLLGELVLDPYPDSTLSGQIKTISFIPKSGETGTVYSLKFIFDNNNTDFRYRLGMAGDLSFVTERKEDVLYIPQRYVKSENEKKYVKVKRNSKEEKVFIKTGMEAEDDIEIVLGVSAGEVVVE